MQPIYKEIFQSVLRCLLLILLITACNPSVEEPTPSTTPTPQQTTIVPTKTTSPSSDNTEELTLWIPPLLAADTPAGSLLNSHITTLEEAFTLVDIQFRIKEDSGPSGILETLSSASLVAPSTLPDIVLLNPTNLNTAALKGLITPLDEFISSPESPEWYEYAVDAAYVDATFFGLPFICQAEAFAYRKEAFEAEPKDWADILGSGETFLLPLGDPRAKFTLVQYSYLGGRFTDENGSPTIDVEILKDLFDFYASAKETGLLPLYSLQLQSAEESQLAFQQGNSNAAVIPLETLLTGSMDDSLLLTPWPTRDKAGVTPTQTLTWAVVQKEGERQELISQVLQWLMEPSFLGELSLTLGWLPTTSAALEEWTETDLSSAVLRLIRTAVPEPSAEEVATYSSLLQNAVQDVINELNTPEDAALSIADQITIP
jgi:ABC-type glycerol-3-phosphate transport system substrate-binding protein